MPNYKARSDYLPIFDHLWGTDWIAIHNKVLRAKADQLVQLDGNGRIHHHLEPLKNATIWFQLRCTLHGHHNTTLLVNEQLEFLEIKHKRQAGVSPLSLTLIDRALFQRVINDYTKKL